MRTLDPSCHAPGCLGSVVLELKLLAAYCGLDCPGGDRRPAHAVARSTRQDRTNSVSEQAKPLRIVVGVDGSDESLNALRIAQRLATVMNAELDATGCWEYPNMRSARITLGSVGGRAGAQAELEAAVGAAFGSSQPAHVTTNLVFGPAETRLIDAGTGADMLVVGRHGRSGLNGVLVGSVSSACVRHAPCPVLVVHGSARETNAISFESWNQIMTNQSDAARIVVGVDGSPSSIRALRDGERIATALGGQVDAVTCWDTPSIWAAPYPLAGADFQGEAKEALDFSLEEAFGHDTPENVTGRLVQAQVRAGLMEASKDAAMLVIGRRGRGGFSGLSLGSVSTACISHAECPVLVVHAGPDEEGIDFAATSARAHRS